MQESYHIWGRRHPLLFNYTNITVVKMTFRHLDSSMPILLSKVLIKIEQHCSDSSVGSQVHFIFNFFCVCLCVLFKISNTYSQRNCPESNLSQYD